MGREGCFMAIETNVQVPYYGRRPVRVPKEKPARSSARAGNASIGPSEGILYGVLIGGLLWSTLILLGVALW